MRLTGKLIGGNTSGTTSVCGWNSGYLFAALITIAFLIIIIGFLAEKKSFITIGAIIGIIAQCLSCLDLLNSIERFLYSGKWIYSNSRINFNLAGPALPFELLLALFFVALLLCSLDVAHSKIYGVIGAVLILARLIPAGYLMSVLLGYRNTSRFLLSPWAIVVSVLFALGSVLLGFFFAPARVKKAKYTDNSRESITRIDRIIRLKELLDNGTITQEEFEAKKKDIIG